MTNKNRPDKTVQADKAEWLEIGMLTRPHGVTGEIRARSSCSTMEDFLQCLETGNVWLWKPDPFRNAPTEPQPDKDPAAIHKNILSIRLHSGVALLRLEGIENRNDAEAIRGSRLLQPEDALPPPEEGTFYYYQLEGLSVINEKNQKIGTVQKVEENPAHAQLVIQPTDGGRPYRVPYVDAFILEAQPANGFLRVHLPPGMREAQS